MEGDERLEAAVERELLEETGLVGRAVRLVGAYSGPGRDPRGPTVSVAFLIEGRRSDPRGSDDAAEACWWSLEGMPALAFDHDRMVRDARRQT